MCIQVDSFLECSELLKISLYNNVFWLKILYKVHNQLIKQYNNDG